MKVGIVGLGLIGGSIAKELKIRSLSTIDVIGYDISEAHSKRAKELGLVDEMMGLDGMVECADIIVLAMPVNIILNELDSFLDLVSERQVLIDTGSTKRHICARAKDHKNRNRFVAAHPLAGTEFSGPDAAIMELFKGKKNIICERDKSDDDAIDQALRLFDFLGMQTVFMEAEEHDKHMAYVSHLSHVSSFTLSLTVLEIEKDEKQIFNLASTGFASTARLAKSNAKTWGPIFDANSEYLVQAIDSYIENLTRFRQNIIDQKTGESEQLMKKANEIKRVLEGIVLNK